MWPEASQPETTGSQHKWVAGQNDRCTTHPFLPIKLQTFLGSRLPCLHMVAPNDLREELNTSGNAMWAGYSNDAGLSSGTPSHLQQGGTWSERTKHPTASKLASMRRYYTMPRRKAFAGTGTSHVANRQKRGKRRDSPQMCSRIPSLHVPPNAPEGIPTVFWEPYGHRRSIHPPVNSGLSQPSHVSFPLSLPFSLHRDPNVSQQDATATPHQRSLISLGID